MIPSLIARLVEKKDLTLKETQSALASVFRGEVSPASLAALLVALRMKGETADEIAGAALAMRSALTEVVFKAPVVVDTCGTGGDGAGSFNISTAAAFVVAGAGFPVAKHGNRSVSSRCGSADVLESLGVKIDAPTYVVERCLRDVGIGFFFAPSFHPAMRHAMPVRRELGLRTIFNLLGPLTNPARANAQVIGVYAPELVDTVARVLVRLGAQHAWVVHGGGHDEIVLSGPTRVAEIANGKIRTRTVTPADFGFKKQSAKALAGGDKDKNADIIRRLLAGHKTPQRDAVVVNAAAALWVAARAAGRRDIKSLKDARLWAERVIDSGAAQKKLDGLVTLSQEALFQ